MPEKKVVTMAKLSSEEVHNLYLNIVNNGGMQDFTDVVEKGGKQLEKLKEELSETNKVMLSLMESGKGDAGVIRKLQEHARDLEKNIKKLNKEHESYREVLDISSMSSAQLIKRKQELRQELSHLSEKLNPERWSKLNDEYRKVEARLSEVQIGTIRVSDSMDITSLSIKDLTDYAKQLETRLNNLPGASKNPDWNKLKTRIAEVGDRLKDLDKSQETTARTLPKTQGRFQRFFTDIKNSASTFYGNIGTILFSGVANGLKKLASDITANSNAIGDRWNRIMTGMRKGYETFLTALASGDWSNFFSNIARAYREGRELAKLQEDLFEMQNASTLTETRNNIEISRQTAIMRDTTKSNNERIAAAEKILELESEILAVKEKTAERERAVALKAISDKTNGTLSSEDMEYMVDNYFNNAEMIDAAGEYLELEEKLKKARRSLKIAQRTAPSLQVLATYEDNVSRLENEMKKMLDDVNGLDKIVELQHQYDLLNDEDLLGYVNAQTGYLKAQADFESATVRAKTTLAKLREELKNENYQKAVDEVERQAKEETNIYKQQYVERKISEEEMNRELERIEMERLQRVNEINRQFGVDIVESTGAVLDNLISSMDGFTQAAADGSEEALDRVIQKSKELNAELERMLADSEAAVARMMEAEQAGMQASLDEDGNRLASDVQQAGEIKNRFADTNTRLTLLSADKDAEMAQLQSLYDQKLIAEEEFQAARNEVIRRYASEAFNIQTQSLQNGLQVASGFLNNISSLVSSIQEAESASLDAQMQKELAAAGDNADKRAAIEEKYEQKKLDLQKKYADIDMGIKIAQTIAAGALAAIQAFGQLGPIAGGIMAGVIAATTAAQVATIVMQRNAIKNSTVSSSSSGTTSVRTVVPDDSGYSEGGFTGYGGRLEPAGIVHRGEYVVPVPEMRDPEAYSHVMAIERIRARRSTRNRLPGFADGGYTGDPSSSGAAAAIKEMTAVFKSLRDNPIKAYTVLSEHNAAQEISNKFKKAASRK